MKTVAFLALLALLPLAAAGTPIPCGSATGCLSDLGLVEGCLVNAGFVEVTLPVGGCALGVATCQFEGYMGGAGGDNVWRNFQFECTPVLA